MLSREESETATLADRILLEMEDCAAEAVASTPPAELTGWQLLDDEGLETLEEGSARLPLPDDFLLLFILRLSGWQRGVTEIRLPGSQAAMMQGSRWAGLRGSRQRPVAVLEASANGGRALRLYGPHDVPVSIVEGWYMPAPRIDSEGNINVPPGAIARLVRLIAGRISREC